MDRVRVEDIAPLDEYRRRRPEAQAAARRLRDRRRVALGDRITLSFENRDTVIYQIQEMMHAEGLAKREQIEHEVETYDHLVPGPGELSATLMVELTDPATLREELDSFHGLDRPGVLALEVGGETAPAEFEPGHSDDTRISAVHYLRFRLSRAAREALRGGAEATLVLAHPRHRARAAIPAATREELAKDLE